MFQAATVVELKPGRPMSALPRIPLQNSFWGDRQNFTGMLMRVVRADVGDVVPRKNDHGPA